MEVTIIYSKVQLEAAVDFISENNLAFLGKKTHIRESILEHVRELAERFPDLNSIGTMGYTILASIEEEEGIDHDRNLMLIEILVDPGLSQDWESEERTYHFAKPK